MDMKNNITLIKESPEEKELRIAKDIETINQLKKAGSDFAKIHNLEFCFISYNKKINKVVSQKLKEMGYNPIKINSDCDEEGEKYWWIEAYKKTIIKKELILKETEDLALFARQYNIIYDGWGTEVED